MALSDWNSICLPGIALLDCNDPIQVHHARTEISFRAKCTKSYLESGVPVARPLQNHPLRNLTQTLEGFDDLFFQVDRSFPYAGADAVDDGLFDKDQTLRLDRSLLLYPLCAPAGDVRTIALAGDHAFFEAQILGVDELPDRPVIDLQPALCKFGHKPRKVKSLALVRSSNQSRYSPEIAFGLCPPI